MIKLILEIMSSQTGKQTFTIHILLILSQSKGNEKMNFGQLVDYDMKNIFL